MLSLWKHTGHCLSSDSAPELLLWPSSFQAVAVKCHVAPEGLEQRACSPRQPVAGWGREPVAGWEEGQVPTGSSLLRSLPLEPQLLEWQLVPSGPVL